MSNWRERAKPAEESTGWRSRATPASDESPAKPPGYVPDNLTEEGGMSHGPGTSFGLNALDSLSVIGLPNTLAIKDALMGDSKDGDFRARFRAAKDRYSAGMDRLSSNNKKSAFAGQMAPMAIPGGALMKGAKLPQVVAMGMGQGVVGGLARGDAKTLDMTRESISDTALDGMMGGVAGGLTAGVGYGVGKAVGIPFKWASKKAKDGLDRFRGKAEERVRKEVGELNQVQGEGIGGLMNEDDRVLKVADLEAKLADRRGSGPTFPKPDQPVGSPTVAGGQGVDAEEAKRAARLAAYGKPKPQPPTVVGPPGSSQPPAPRPKGNETQALEDKLMLAKRAKAAAERAQGPAIDNLKRFGGKASPPVEDMFAGHAADLRREATNDIKKGVKDFAVAGGAYAVNPMLGVLVAGHKYGALRDAARAIGGHPAMLEKVVKLAPVQQALARMGGKTGAFQSKNASALLYTLARQNPEIAAILEEHGGQNGGSSAKLESWPSSFGRQSSR